MSFSRAALWDVLDRAGVPFRMSQEALVAIYGTQPSGWTDFVRYCHLPGGDGVFSDLAHGLVLPINGKADLSRPVEALAGYVRWSRWAGRNHARAVKMIAAHFGAGRDSSVSNTVATTWGDAYCNVTATVFPPRLNNHGTTNSRHTAVPGSATECTITVNPDWFPAPSPQELSWLSDWTADLPVPAALTGWSMSVNWAPIPDGCAGRPAGYGFATGDAAIIAVSQDRRMLIVPVARIVGVDHHVLTPARGGGRSAVSLRYLAGDGGDAGLTRSLSLLSGVYDDPTHKPFATGIAARIGVSLSTSTQQDC